MGSSLAARAGRLTRQPIRWRKLSAASNAAATGVRWQLDTFVHFVGVAIAEYLGYITGKTVLRVFIPSIRIESLDRQKAYPSWKWKGFTYRRGKQRYFYCEAIQLVGIVFWLILGSLVLVIYTYAT